MSVVSKEDQNTRARAHTQAHTQKKTVPTVKRARKDTSGMTSYDAGICLYIELYDEEKKKKTHQTGNPQAELGHRSLC